MPSSRRSSWPRYQTIHWWAGSLLLVPPGKCPFPPHEAPNFHWILSSVNHFLTLGSSRIVFQDNCTEELPIFSQMSNIFHGRSEVVQSSPTFYDPMNCKLSCFSIHGIFQARVLEWVAISFSRGSSQPRYRTQVSHIVGRHFTIGATTEFLTYLFFLFFPWYIYLLRICLIHHYNTASN